MPSSSLVIDLLKNVQQLSRADFEDFFAKMLAIRKSLVSEQLSAEEITLIQEIQDGLPRKIQLRFEYLIGKRDAATISDEEYQELVKLTETVEAYDLKRLQLISRLAELRKLSLADTVEAFNLRPISHG